MNRELDDVRTNDPALAEALEDYHGSPGPQTGGPSGNGSQGQCIESHQLFARDDRLFIWHDGELYCLRKTRRNRLILTK